MMEYASQDILDKWLSQIPARRFASPYELKGVRSQEKECQVNSKLTTTGVPFLRIRCFQLYDWVEPGD